MRCTRACHGMGTRPRANLEPTDNNLESRLSKEDLIEMKGKIEEILPDARYRVLLENGHALVAYTGGKMRKHRIKIIAGDNVTVEMSPYDLTKGRITFRHLEPRAGGAPRPPMRRR
jgi:translation initiation factor IF-1